MRAVLPLLLGAILFAVGRHYSGLAAGAFMAAVGVVMGWVLGKLLRGRAVQQAPPPPAALPGEIPILHGPLSLLQPQGPAREAWGYLSDRRLSLHPLDAAPGVELSLADLEEIRPQQKGWRSGRLSLVFKGQVWKLQVPDARRWERALRAAARKER
jgi:hypothetical protein